MLSRRHFLAALAASAFEAPGAYAAAADIQARLADLERTRGGRLGVCVHAPATGRSLGYRAEERFAMCSTHKFLAAAFVLQRVDRELDSLDRRVTYSRESLVAYSPATEKHVGEEGMTVGELCEAALTLSDNTAANLILESLGGPAGFTAMTRALGDGVTRLDRIEPALNEAKAGDPRDTTTPAAMAEDLRALVLGDVLSAPSRARLAAWLVANETGDERLRAGIPKGWRVGDKTGSGGGGATDDIAVIWPPEGGPVVVTAYYAGSSATDVARSAVLAEVGRLVAGI